MMRIGRWEFKVKGYVRWSFGLGFELVLYTWHRAYPWLAFHASVGPFSIHIDATRPDDLALEVRRALVRGEVA